MAAIVTHRTIATCVAPTVAISGRSRAFVIATAIGDNALSNRRGITLNTIRRKPPTPQPSRIQGTELKNRLLLKEGLEAQGFVNYDKEWWHFTYQPEPYPDTYFDFPVDPADLTTRK